MITLCERLAGQDANVTTVPVSVLKFTRQVTRLFEWTNDAADRLAFSEVKIVPLSPNILFTMQVPSYKIAVPRICLIIFTATD